MGPSKEEQQEKIRQKEAEVKAKRKERDNNSGEFKFGISGIYFLYFESKIVYIGESKCVMSRISQHYKEKKKQFDKYTYKQYDVSDKQRKKIERGLIKRIKPKYNITHKKSRRSKVRLVLSR